MAAVMRMRPVHSVASQQKIWTPLVIAIIMLAAVKYASPICGRPVANMWCTHRPNAMKAFATSDSTMAGYPKIARRELASMMEDTIPSAGMKMMYTSGWPKNQNTCW